MRTLLVCSILALTLSSCTNSDSDDDGEGGGGGASSANQAISAISDAGGRVNFNIAVEAGENGVLLEAACGEGELHLVSMSGPQGALGIPSTWSALNPSSNESCVAAVAIPTNAGSIPAGNYNVNFELKDGSRFLAARTVSAVITKKRDSDLSGGTLKVNMILYGPVAGNLDATASLQNSVEVWKELFARANINLNVQWYEFAGDDDIPDPSKGDSLYEAITSQTRDGALNVVIAARVRGLSDGGTRYGKIGATPGPIMAGPRSVVALSILAITGADGRFDFENRYVTGGTHNDEERLAGEELARLGARYLGLEDIVTFRGGSSNVSDSDSLTDTPSCLTETDCRNEKPARNNTMFPKPLRKFDNDFDEFYAREIVTEQQSAVLNASALVR
jgi:hypothetical protein